MEGLRAPVGDQPPGVYWIRRAVALLAGVLVLVVGYFLIVSPMSGNDAKTPASTASGSPNPASTASPNPTSTAAAAARACTSADVTLTVAPNPYNFPTGSLPTFDVSIKNNAATPCLMDTAVDSDLVITSGSDRVFATADCEADATIQTRQLLLDAGAEQIIQVTWNRQRSAPGCAVVDAIPGTGTYNATLTLQGISAAEARFSLSD